jgi:hypothetical protein
MNRSRKMSLLTELGNLLGVGFYKYTAPDGAGRRYAGHADLSRQNPMKTEVKGEGGLVSPK